MDAEITLTEMPGKAFHGTAARSAAALGPSSRTLLTEVDVPNKDHVLRSGLYVQVGFSIPADRNTVAIPADAIIFGQAGLQVAVQDGSNHAHLRDVVIAKGPSMSTDLASASPEKAKAGRGIEAVLLRQAGLPPPSSSPRAAAYLSFSPPSASERLGSMASPSWPPRIGPSCSLPPQSALRLAPSSCAASAVLQPPAPGTRSAASRSFEA